MKKRTFIMAIAALACILAAIYFNSTTAEAKTLVVGKEAATVDIGMKVIDGDYMNAEARKTFDAVNALRAEKGLQPLVWAKDFDALGKLRAAEIQELYSHTRPDGKPRTIVKDGVIIRTGENIAYGYMSAEEVMAGWTKSPGHYANMTNVRYQSYYCACFVTYDEDYGWPWYTWVQLFCYEKLDSEDPNDVVFVDSITDNNNSSDASAGDVVTDNNVSADIGEPQYILVENTYEAVEEKTMQNETTEEAVEEKKLENSTTQIAVEENGNQNENTVKEDPVEEETIVIVKNEEAVEEKKVTNETTQEAVVDSKGEDTVVSEGAVVINQEENTVTYEPVVEKSATYTNEQAAVSEKNVTYTNESEPVVVK